MADSVVKWNPPVIAVIGMGTGLENLGPKAMEWIAAAEVLVGGKRHLDLFPGHPGEKIPLASPLSEQLEKIGELAMQKRTAILASGDPLFFGIGRKLCATFGAERLVVFPNVTSVQHLCARMCIPWDGIETVSLHGRHDPRRIEGMFACVDSGRTIAVLTDPDHTPQWIAEELIRSGRSGCGMIVGEDLGSAKEKVRSFSPVHAAKESFSSLNVVLIRPSERTKETDAENAPVFGFPEEAFEREAGMITKMEVRAVALASLQLGPGMTLWDLGAGTGSVSIEAARIAPLRIFAVEKNEARYSQMLRNLENFGVSGIEAVCGSASDSIANFSAPDRVFIGGSGDDLEAILETVADQLLPGGRVVQTIVLLHTLEKVRNFWAGRGFELSISQLQVSRSTPTGKDLRLEALNPVFVVSAWRV